MMCLCNLKLNSWKCSATNELKNALLITKACIYVCPVLFLLWLSSRKNSFSLDFRNYRISNIVSYTSWSSQTRKFQVAFAAPKAAIAPVIYDLIYLFIYLLIYLFICLFIYFFVHVFIYLNFISCWQKKLR